MGRQVQRKSLRHDTFREAERRLRFTTGWSGIDESKALGYLSNAIKGDDVLTLRVVDFLVAKVPPSKAYAAERLDAILMEAGSAYRVATHGEVPALERRMDPTVEAVARAAMEEDDDAATLLRRAWSTTLGVEPNPSEGYRQAVRAVEAIVVQAVLPTDSEATLGRAIGHLRSTAERWTFELRGRDGGAEGLQTVTAMLALLWTSQYDRHVSEGTPLHMTGPEAEAALPLAATLVNWFRTDVVRRAD